MLCLETTPQQVQALQDALKKYLSEETKIQNHTVVFNDIRSQGFVVFVEFFTPPLPWPEFTAVRQSLNYFALNTMQQLQIEVAADGKR